MAFTFTNNGANTVELTKYVGFNAHVTIPSTYQGRTVTSIGSMALFGGPTGGGGNGTTITSITIPASVTYFGFQAFCYLSKITSITIPATVTSFGEAVFYNCAKLTHVTFLGSPSMGNNTFQYCATLTSITFRGASPPSSIGSGSFANIGPNPIAYIPNTAGWAGVSTPWNGLTVVVQSAPPPGGPPCFPAGTRLLTNNGNKAVETLTTDDRIITADGRSVPFKLYSTVIEKTTEASAPYHIPAGTFGNKAITLSPLHAIQSSKGVWQIPCDAAKQFAGIRQVNLGERVEYFHVELPNFFTDNIVAEGNVVESFAAKQTKGIKHIYTQNAKLNGYTRVSPAAKKALTL
jgi:hypothetical protein